MANAGERQRCNLCGACGTVGVASRLHTFRGNRA